MFDTLNARFRSVAAGQPDRTAVRGPDVTLTYRELDELSDRLADAIRAAGAPPGPVAVRMERGGYVPVAVLAAGLLWCWAAHAGRVRRGSA